MGKVVQFPGAEQRGEFERYVKRAEMAQLAGVSLTTLDLMVAAGMPSHKWGRMRRFKPSVALAWLEKERPKVKSWSRAA